LKCYFRVPGATSSAGWSIVKRGEASQARHCPTSGGSRATLTRLGSGHDVVFSCEGSRVESDQLSLTTAGIGAVVLNVKGRASHAGDVPERGRNALYELAHQILQTRDLSNPEIGLKMN
jgi:glutamate carboxypeptidase